jgi:hypothetical protein
MAPNRLAKETIESRLYRLEERAAANDAACAARAEHTDGLITKLCIDFAELKNVVSESIMGFRHELAVVSPARRGCCR